MKAKKLPSGRWRCQVYLGENEDGKKIRKSVTADTKKEAEYLAHQMINESETEYKDCTVKQAVSDYIKNRDAVLSPSTLVGYDQLRRNAYRTIENVKLSKITAEQIQTLINEYATTHSSKSTRNAYHLLKSAIKAVRPGMVISVKLPAKQVLEYHVPNDETVAEMLNQCDGYLRIAILLASIGTLRRGEICALEYSDIDDNIIHVHRAAVEDESGNVHYRTIPKTASSDRYIEFPRKVIEEIGTGDGLIVPIKPRTLSSRWNRLKKKMALDCRFHDLRHYAASIMHAIGVPDQYIMERGGWASDTVLKSVYRNVLDDKKKEFSDKSNEHFEHLF